MRRRLARLYSDIRDHFVDIVFVAGLGLIAAGAATLSATLGLIIGGALLVGASFTYELGGKK